MEKVSLLKKVLHSLNELVAKLPQMEWILGLHKETLSSPKFYKIEAIFCHT
jgi:hypothetical protein